MAKTSTGATNRLAGSTSPYLLQHAANPVAWQPWDPKALGRARREGKPIFLSVGYSACHWCHVMARESFEDEATAAFLNAHFVSIKVDREERPDLDALYMSAVQAMTGRGGWPMTVFLTPDLKPFYAGTYFPKEPRHGMPAFGQVLEAVADAWANGREEIETSAGKIADAITTSARRAGGGDGDLDAGLLAAAVHRFGEAFDAARGGFGGAPKFPPATTIRLLLAHHHRTGEARVREMAVVTLDAMARGGLNDQLAGGFHRYSVDADWLVPHFEKMLYDNALLAVAYTEAYQATGDARHARTARATLDWMLEEMADPAGGFHSALSAESEGEEGTFYAWAPDGLRDVLGDNEADLIGRYFGVTEAGHFEGKNVLHVPAPAETFAEQEGLAPEDLRRRVDAARQALLKARQKRERPHTDDKVLADWNALAVSAFARAGRVLDEPRYRAAAERAADFLLGTLWDDAAGLLHAYRDGTAHTPAFLDDYAYLLRALVDLYEATFDAERLRQARRVAEAMQARFADAEGGGFFETPEGQGDLLARLKRGYDQARPNGNAVAARSLLRLAALTGEERYRETAVATLRTFRDTMAKAPEAAAGMLLALDFHLGPVREVVVAGPTDAEATRTLLAEANRAYLPRGVLAWFDPRAADADERSGAAPILEGRTLQDDQPAAYVCTGGTCAAPVTTAEALGDKLGGR